jgi:uncharacterized protein with PQ loop repeat
MEFGQRHRTERLGIRSRFNIGIVSSIDVMTYVVSLISLSFATHQVWLIWSRQDASSVSLVMWVGFTLAHIVWALYGYVHHERLIFYVHATWVFFCALILVGIVAFS